MGNGSWLRTNLESFNTDGVCFLGQLLDQSEIEDILQPIKESRHFDAHLFLSESAFSENPTFKNVNPIKGRNFLEKITPRLASIDNSVRLREFLCELLGNSYEILDRKVICGIPTNFLPKWIKTKLARKAVNNLGGYIKPKYRDITYFHGIDYHQDLIDWPRKEPSFITLYVYLDDVGPDEAPLTMLLGSHRLGASEFPHDLELRDSNDRIWTYSSSAETLQCSEKQFIASAGSAAAWHACTLHGTTPAKSNKARISLRYLIAVGRNSVGSRLVEQVNRSLSGKICLEKMRRDQTFLGDTLPQGNKLIESLERT